MKFKVYVNLKPKYSGRKRVKMAEFREQDCAEEYLRSLANVAQYNAWEKITLSAKGIMSEHLH